jgi:DNA-binding transcriptional LysR family regulator
MHLKFFYDAVVYESITEAAKKNHITQSAVSQAITKLELIFGKKLAMHNKQKFQLTEDGQVVFEQARDIFKSVQLTFEKLNQTSDEVKGSVHFATTKSLGMSFLPPTYKKCQSALPNLQLNFRLAGISLIRSYLKNDYVEFAIVVYDHNFDQFEKHTIKKGKMNLYRSTQATSKTKGIIIDDHEGLYVNELKNFIVNTKQKLHIHSHAKGWDLVARFTDFNLGLGFFPDYIVESNRYPQIEIAPYDIPEFDYEICAVHKKSTQLSKSAKTFLEYFTL